MSVAATWSTKATPWAVVGGAAMLSLGLASMLHAALVVAHGGAPWGAPAYICMALAAALPCLRFRRELRQQSIILTWDTAQGGFRNIQRTRPYELKEYWRGWKWVTLGVECPDSGRLLYLVVWKSSISPPLWSELALRLEAGGSRPDRQ